MNTKLATLASVFVISSLVYFSLLNQFVIKNTLPQAAGLEVTVSFLEDKVSATTGVPFDVNIFFNSTDEVENAFVPFQYGSNLNYVKPQIGADYVSAFCQTNNFQFNGLVEVFFDDKEGKGYIGRNVIAAGSDGKMPALPTGSYCYATLSFQYQSTTGNIDPNVQTFIALRDPNSPECTIGDPKYDPFCRWDILGPKGPFTIKLDSLKSRILVAPTSGGGGITAPTPTTGSSTGGTVPTPTTPSFTISTPTPTIKVVDPTPTPIQVTCDTCPPDVPYCDPNLSQLILDCIYQEQAPDFDCTILDINRDGIVDAGDLTASSICKRCFCSISPTIAPSLAPTSTPITPTSTPLPTTSYATPIPNTTLRLLTPTMPYTSPTSTPIVPTYIIATNTPAPIAATATSAPITSPTVVDVCPNVIKGNYDCSPDGLITLSDYEAFRVAFFKYNRQKVYTKTADGNLDGENTLEDFEICRTSLILN